MTDRQKRKQRRRAAAQTRPSRSEQKNEEARAALVPLAPGERPTAVTVGAVVAAALGLSNLGLYIAGVDIRGEDANAGALLFGGLMLTAAWGMWRVRYWAVLGMQALLALAVIGSAGTLFWFMVKAMARIQMPTRDQ